MSFRSILPNALSVSRIVCVPFVLFGPSSWWLPILAIAVVSDFLDGRLARRWHTTSTLGTTIDPIGDKGVAAAFAWVFWSCRQISVPQLVCFFARDIALVVFSLILVALGRHRQWRVQSFYCGKSATALQAAVVAFLCLGAQPPGVLFWLLALLGIGSLPELLIRAYRGLGALEIHLLP